MAMNNRLLRPKLPKAAPTPTSTYRILTQSSSTLTTEAGDRLRTEQN
jgi:hypothetical protein